MILKYMKELHSNYKPDHFGEIIGLEANEYSQLYRQGFIEWTDDMENSEEEYRSESLIVYNNELFDLSSWDGTQDNIRKLLENMLICKRKNGLTRQVELAHTISLWSWLENPRNIPARIPSLSVLSQCQAEAFEQRVLERMALTLASASCYTGRVSCGCGFIDDEFGPCHDLECYSDYVVVRNGICYIHFGGSFGMISFLDLFPFQVNE